MTIVFRCWVCQCQRYGADHPRLDDSCCSASVLLSWVSVVTLCYLNVACVSLCTANYSDCSGCSGCSGCSDCSDCSALRCARPRRRSCCPCTRGPDGYVGTVGMRGRTAQRVHQGNMPYILFLFIFILHGVLHIIEIVVHFGLGSDGCDYSISRLVDSLIRGPLIEVQPPAGIES